METPAEIARRLERMAWLLEDEALAVDEKAASLEWELQARQRGWPVLQFDYTAGHYKLRVGEGVPTVFRRSP